MTNELFDIDPLEVSLVDRGANKRRILVRKRDDEGETMDIEKMALSEDQLGAVAAVLGELGGGDAATDDQRAAAAEILGTVIELGGLYPAPEEAADDAEEVAAADDAEAADLEAADDTEEAIELADDAVEEEEEAVEMSKRDADLFAKQAAELEEVKKALEVERGGRLVAEHVQKCATEFPSLFAADTAGPVLKSIHGKLDDAEYDFVLKCLTESEQFAKASNLFGEVGNTGAPEEVAEDASGKLNAIAKRYKAEGKADTFAKCYTLAMNENPQLVTEIHSTKAGE